MSRIPKISGNKMIRYLQGKGVYHNTKKRKPCYTKTRRCLYNHTCRKQNSEDRYDLAVLSDTGINKDEFVSDHRRGLIK